MPFDCQFRALHGADACLTECPTHEPVGGFSFARVERPGDVPPADPRVVDVAVLDMHHGWPNLGHDSLVHAVQTAVCDLQDALAEVQLSVRVISYDVRRGLMIPEAPGGRHEVYVGTGGPGHLDPARNDGTADGAQGIAEDPSWEAPLFRVFDRIMEDPHAALFGVCHTFGVMCRWLGAAEAVLRGPEKGGKSAGITENVLAEPALQHPWFRRFSEALPDGRHFRVLDNRLYDLIPPRPLPAGLTGLAHEALGHNGPPGDALTILEAARDASLGVPRVLGVNHHPEVVNRQRLAVVLRKKLERGNVSREWYDERMRTLTEPIEDAHGDRLLHLTSSYTLLAPLRIMLFRAAERRAEALGVRFGVRLSDVPTTYSLSSDALTTPSA